MNMRRRTFLGSLLSASVLPFCKVDLALAAPSDPGSIFWVHVQGTGGWDQALFCDPKPNLRPSLSAAQKEIRMAESIPYLAFADFGLPAAQGFFSTHADRLLVINGIDTGTNNHTVGEAYSASGSNVPDYPCWAAQVAAVHGQGQPMPFISYGGYDRTGGMLAPARIPDGTANLLERLGAPSRDTSDQAYLSDPIAAAVRKAHEARVKRKLASARLPDRRRELEALLSARASEGALSKLTIPSYDPNATSTEQQLKLALSAFQAGLTASVGVTVGPFDTHDANDTGQAQGLQSLFRVLSAIIKLTEQQGVPCVVLATSDFGRTPHMTGSGTDHHPVSSMLVLVNQQAQQKGVALPVGQVIGASTDGSAATALQCVKVHPTNLTLSDQGIKLTPGHVLRVMRRLAGIDEAAALASFPIAIEGDLNLG